MHRLYVFLTKHTSWRTGGMFILIVSYLLLFVLPQAQAQQQEVWFTGIAGGPIVPFSKTTHPELNGCVRPVDIVGFSPSFYVERRLNSWLSARANFKGTPLRVGVKFCHIQDDETGTVVTGSDIVTIVPNHLELMLRANSRYMSKRVRYTAGAGFSVASSYRSDDETYRGGVGTNFAYSGFYHQVYFTNFMLCGSLGMEIRTFPDQFITFDITGQMGLRKIFVYNLDYWLYREPFTNRKISSGNNLVFAVGYKLPLLILERDRK